MLVAVRIQLMINGREIDARPRTCMYTPSTPLNRLGELQKATNQKDARPTTSSLPLVMSSILTSQRSGGRPPLLLQAIVRIAPASPSRLAPTANAPVIFCPSPVYLAALSIRFRRHPTSGGQFIFSPGRYGLERITVHLSSKSFPRRSLHGNEKGQRGNIQHFKV